MRQFIIHTLVILFILLLGASPLISTMIAGSIAEANGCTLHEGFVNPCIINGEDWGQDLYTFGVLGWLAIGTIPLALIVAGVYLVVVIVVNVILAARRRKAAETTATDGSGTDHSDSDRDDADGNDSGGNDSDGGGGDGGDS